MSNQKYQYRNRHYLKQAYDKLGTTRNVGRDNRVSQATIIYWMRKFHIPRIPKLHLFNNPSGWGRLAEFYIIGHPFFRKHFKDLGEVDDKSKYDGLWYGDRINVKSSHASKRFSFRIKIVQGRHVATYYICCCYDDSVDPLIPIEIFVIPSKVAPYSTITVSHIDSGKYARFRLSLKRGKEFSNKAEFEYNKRFKKKYRYPKS